ncbi:helix-turn-helix domain-containing protein [Paraburkholderia caffeinilytica]|uniref:helix-turn-helix domain-containing protein n=1 Tax=Paraburkholderia caffeinilytica TaxID=1761016 RepID=UPI000E2199EF|nr:helix-turn-helix transcriptional regulator [Paraburkholderia caffeinilytica]
MAETICTCGFEPVKKRLIPSSLGRQIIAPKRKFSHFTGRECLELAEIFGAVLREHRLRAELTQEQLAFEADIRRNYVSMLELGQHQPTLTMLFALAGALQCSPSDLLSDVEKQLTRARPARRRHPTRARARVTASTVEVKPSRARAKGRA